MSDDELRICRLSIYAIVMAERLPTYAKKINREYESIEGENIPFRSFGYNSLEALLRDHPNLQETTDEDGNVLFVAKPKASSLHIFNLIKGQKKKKSKSKRGAPRSNFQRAGSVRGKPSNNSFQRFSSSRTSFNGRSARGGFAYRPPSYPQFAPRIQPMASSSMITPEEGMKRIERVLQKCRGSTELNNFCRTYQQLHNVMFEENELKKYFNTADIREIIEKHANGRILVAKCDDTLIFTMQEVVDQVEKAREAALERAKLCTVIAPEKKHCLIPSIAKLLELVVELLIDCYPQPIKLAHLGEKVFRRLEIEVLPLKVYGKSWEELVETVFKTAIAKRFDEIMLTPAMVKKHNLSVGPRKEKPTRFTLQSTGIVCESDDDDDDVADSQSTTTNEYSSVLNEKEEEWKEERHNGKTISDQVDALEELMRKTPLGLSVDEPHRVRAAFRCSPFMFSERKEQENNGTEKKKMVRLLPSEKSCKPSGEYWVMKIVNDHDCAIAFKVKTSNPNAYGIQPASGFVEKHGSLMVPIVRKDCPFVQERIMVCYVKNPQTRIVSEAFHDLAIVKRVESSVFPQ